MPLPRDDISLSPEMLDVLMPMHLVVGATGHIIHAGPSLLKLLPGGDLIGSRFLEAFELRRPRDVSSVADLVRLKATPMKLRLRAGGSLSLKGQMVGCSRRGYLLIDLSFGIGVVEAVRKFGLTNADFSATDSAVEMLYLAEAKSAVMAAMHNLNSRLQAAKIAAEEQALTDTLTGLKNRRAMDLVLAHSAETRQPFGLMHIDLDFFKAVNDRLGHAAGDFVLQNVARILTEQTRRQDTVSRAGGDEFVVILPGLTDIDRLATIADRIIRHFEKPIYYNNQECRISGSIGMTVTTLYDTPDTARMLQDADFALYTSKARGRARYTVFSPLEKGGNPPSETRHPNS